MIEENCEAFGEAAHMDVPVLFFDSITIGESPTVYIFYLY
jgi:hypothetical protein